MKWKNKIQNNNIFPLAAQRTKCVNQSTSSYYSR